MRNEIDVDEIRQLVPTNKETLYFQILGLFTFIAAFFFSRKNIIHPCLLILGSGVLSRGFEKVRFQKILKQIIE